MYKTAKIRCLPLIFSLLISLGIGGISAWLTSGNTDVYDYLNRPPLAPPGFIFPIVWTVLFILMGISSYLIFISDSPAKTFALVIYGAQLLLNLGWSLIFFNLKNYDAAFVWLIVLWAVILIMIITFRKISPVAAYLQIPYLLWVTFAGYLTFMIARLN